MYIFNFPTFKILREHTTKKLPGLAFALIPL